MRTPIDFLLTEIAVKNYSKNWQELNDKQKAELEGHVVTQAKKGSEYNFVKPKAGTFYGRHVVAGEDVAADSITSYIKKFVNDYSQFALDVGVTIQLPDRTVKAECPVSELSQWKQEVQQWASAHNGDALEIARDACRDLNNNAEKISITEDEATPKKLSGHQKSIERKVFRALAAGREAFGQLDDIAQYLNRSASKLKDNVKPGDSKYHIRDMYLKATEKGQKLAESVEKLNIDLEMNKYASLLEQLSDLELSVPKDEEIEGAADLRAERNAFARFNEHAKELISQFPAGEKGVGKAKQLMLSVLEPAHNNVILRLNAVCEQLLNAQIEAAHREKRTIKTPIPHILNQLAMRFEVEQENGQKANSKSPDYQGQSRITGFDDLSKTMQESLMGKVAALHRTNEYGAVYSFDDAGFGIRAVEGADTLVHSVQTNVTNAINDINALAKAAGFKERVPPLPDTKRYLVSELVDLNESLADWATENPHLMDLNELQGGLKQLASCKSSDPDTAKGVYKNIDEHLNKVIIACVDAGGSAIDMLDDLSNKAVAWAKDGSKQAKPTCDYVAQKAREQAESMRRLQRMQVGERALLPDQLTGKQFVAAIAALEPLFECAADDSVAIDQLDKLYFEAAQTLSDSGVKCADIPSVIEGYSSGARATAKARMKELTDFMTQSEAAHGSESDKLRAARGFASIIPSVSSCPVPKAPVDEKKDVPPPPPVAVGAPPPPPPPPPVGMVAVDNKPPGVSGQKPKPKSIVTTSSTSPRGLAGFDPAKVKLRKTGSDTAGEIRATQKNVNSEGDLFAEIRKGIKLKRVNDSGTSPEQSAQPEGEDQKNKKRQAEKKMLDNQLSRLEAEVEHLKDLLKVEHDDSRVVKGYKQKLTNAQEKIKHFYLQNPGFEKGPLTAKQLAIPEKSDDTALVTALKNRVGGIHGNSGSEGSDNEDNDGSWTDDEY
ncbi:hypothetical protein [Endozoicomonas lisbonensis]|uniref:WH2 domain-containing protein n=1 Tax=Endozoicomonas lisbonensis TaxID=3120522 RepID=A0ABV2SHV8_9GAMM